MYFKLFQVFGQEYLNDAKTSLESCLQVAIHDPNEGATFYMSSVGIQTMAAIIYKEMNEHDKSL